MNPLTTLQSGIARSYRGRFVLDEDSLRRIQAVLAKGAASLAFETHVIFHIEREDDRFYETADLGDVLSDANLPGKRVQSLSIELRRADPTSVERPWQEPWVVQAAFIRSYGDDFYSRFRNPFNGPVSLAVTTPDRNWALLMADELEPQVQRVLAANRTSWLIYPAAVAFLLLAGAVSEVLKAQAVSTLLLPYTIWKLALMLPLGIAAAWMLHSQPLRAMLPSDSGRWFGNESVFLWGEELKQYPQRQRFRRNVLWGVVVAFLVSVLASLLAWVLTTTVAKS